MPEDVMVEEVRHVLLGLCGAVQTEKPQYTTDVIKRGLLLAAVELEARAKGNSHEAAALWLEQVAANLRMLNAAND